MLQAADAGQTLLRLQANTIRAMYDRIGRALAATAPPSGRDSRRPQDYLVFLALGHREAVDTAPEAEGAMDMDAIAGAFDVARAPPAADGGGGGGGAGLGGLVGGGSAYGHLVCSPLAAFAFFVSKEPGHHNKIRTATESAQMEA